MADILAKPAAADTSNLKIEYDKITKSTIATEVKKEGIAKWQEQWERTNKGALCRSLLPSVE